MASYRELIIMQLNNELNPDEECLRKMVQRLNKANAGELERTYETFARFGVKTVMEILN